MRKKIGKRIGTGPITLAVFALAAFISVGLLLTVNGGVTQAQGLPGTERGPLPDGDDCEVVLAAPMSPPTGDPVAETDGSRVEGGGCIVSGDSVDVEFLNYDVAPTAPAIDSDTTVVVYVTGGEGYSNVQAMGMKPGASQDTALGARGVGEYSFTVDGRTAGLFGTVEPGSESITVTRNMAKDGEVYLFVYKPTVVNFAQGTGDEGTGGTPGLPLNVLAKAQTAWPDDFKFGVYDSVSLAAATTDYNAFETEAERADNGLTGTTAVEVLMFPTQVRLGAAETFQVDGPEQQIRR